MISDSLRNVSSDVVVISIALLGVITILIALAWKRFLSSIMTLSIYWRREYLKITSITFVIPVLIPLVVYTAVGVYYPSLAQNSVVLVMMLIGGISILYLLVKAIRWVINRIRGIRKANINIKLDSNILICIQCTFCLGLSAMCSLFALLGASPGALDINIGQNQVENYNWSRWILDDAILLFVMGALQMGFLYMLDRRSRTN